LTGSSSGGDRRQGDDRPDYKVYRSGGRRGKASEPAGGKERGPAGGEGGKGEDRPEYTVYRSRPSLRDRLTKPDVAKLRERLRGRGGEQPPGEAPERPLWRRALKWVGIFALAWILLSLITFAISAQIQKAKLVDGVSKTLDGGPLLLTGQTVLVLGTDVRSGAFAGPEEAEPKNCIEAVVSGRPKDGSCKNPPYRSDTIMLIRAGAFEFHKLSIPRDTLAEIPGQGPQKINSAYASGGAKLAVRTVEGLLGINVDQVAIIDFDGLRKFIDTIGGIDVDLPTKVCSSLSGGAFNLNLDEGENHLDGFQAITLARTRSNTCGTGEFASSDDVDRAAFQQLILDGIKGKLTSITSLPMNFIKGPLIGWNAPKAMVSSMGFFTMPQLVISAAIGGGGTDVLEPSGTTAAGNLVVSPEECERAAEELLGEKPPRKPNCPQG
jgi:LCP family protein required for cell wall assembly